MEEKALLLCGDSSSTNDRRAERLLEFFEVPYERQSTTDFRFPEQTSTEVGPSYRLLCAAETFATLMEKLRDLSSGWNECAWQIDSVFLYCNGDPVVLANVVSQLSGANTATCKSAETDTEWHIADDPDGMCGAMRGLRIKPAGATLASCDFLEFNEGAATTPLIASRDKVAFLKITWQKIPFFVTSGPLLDIDAELATWNFDVRDHLFSAVPVVSYIRSAFTHSGWNTPGPSACLVLDDPLLKPRYGFVRYRKLLTLMKQFQFCTSIAFIPYNWRRSDPKIVQLFRDNPEYYSLCIHGCDHISREFGSSDRLQLRSAASEAIRRMSLHQQRTGLEHDRIMVFPQGVFSKEAISELKRAGFTAVVNTEVHSDPPSQRKVKISDVWDVAVRAYDDFPIFTRRYPAQGIENFAFDILLGKPCLPVIHHGFCRDGYIQLVEFIKQLNALKASLVWHKLSDVIRQTYRQKELSADSAEIEMYGNELMIENRSESAKRYFIRRRECNPKLIEALHAGLTQVSWSLVGDYIEFELELGPSESKLVTLHFKAAEDVGQVRKKFAYRAKTILRRHLSEARDNYLAPAHAQIVGCLTRNGASGSLT